MNKDRKEVIKFFLQNGKKTEAAFASLFKNAVPCSEEDDIKKHCDVDVIFRCDVKGLKKIRRSDKEQNEHFHYVEIKNVLGETGWAYAEEVEFFAFELKKYWIIVEKYDLQEFIKNNVEKTFTPSPELYKLYRREGRKDVMTLITSYDLCYIKSVMMKKEQTIILS